MASHEAIAKRVRAKFARLYGENRAPELVERFLNLVDGRAVDTVPALPVSEKDVVLITYGDMVHADGESPLATLHRFLKTTVHPFVNSVHILPFFPYSSDDGFSVMDYELVDPNLGDWGDVRAMSQDFNLMFDAVFNHISAKSDWFQGFLRWEDPYRDYFVVMDPAIDLSAVVRPRALPLLHKFDTADGPKHVWTTFSDDQIDLNAMNPDVLLELLRILLFYVDQGAKLIRLDAIAFLWKIPGTNCIHLEETHLIIQLMRDMLEWVAPEVVIITETNVPHEENISYFGDGSNEAHMVYQFPLPPLVLHTLHTGDTTALTKWASGLEPAGEQTTFLNFTASHDGVGLRPVTGLLSDDEIDALVTLAETHGGHVSYKNNSDGTQSPYELNVTYFDAITDPAISQQDPGLAVDRFIVSQAIMLSLAGVPGIYFHNLFGSQNDPSGVERTGRYRSINREKFHLSRLQNQLADSSTIRAMVFARYRELLQIRTGEPAFHPLADQKILDLGPGVFALQRKDKTGVPLLALHNVTGEDVPVSIPSTEYVDWGDLITDGRYTAHDGSLQITLRKFQILWLKPRSG